MAKSRNVKPVDTRSLYNNSYTYRGHNEWNQFQQPKKIKTTLTQKLPKQRIITQHDIDEERSNINDCIKLLRRQQFSRSNKDGSILIQDMYTGHEVIKKPIDLETEAKIQALRYLNGMLLIMKFTNDETAKIATLTKIQRAYDSFYQTSTTINDVKKMAERFAIILSKSLAITKENARKQVTMARDLSSMLEDQPIICTASTTSNKDGNKLSIEVSENTRISADYYQQFEDAEKNKKTTWLDDTKKFAGMNDQANTWLDYFFTDPKKKSFSMHRLSEQGHAAPPSARWLPLPSNIQDVTTYTANLDNRHNIEEETVKTSKFTRMGITSAYDISNIEEQEKIAKAILIEIFSKRIVKDYINYYKQYGALASTEFYVNYETLLSPHHLESHFYEKGVLLPRHKDNNAAFVKMAKKALDIAQHTITKMVHKQIHDAAFNGELEIDTPKPTLIFSQTNSAVNKLADLPFTNIQSPGIKKFAADQQHRGKKISGVEQILSKLNKLYPHNTSISELKSFLNKHGKATINISAMISHLDKIKHFLHERKEKLGISYQTINQIIQRINAAIHLQQLMANKAPYKDLPNYQHNIMQAALELLTVGDQGTTLMGCKSARDRTAILAGAIKTMQENPTAMYNWQVLDAGIVTSLKQGHHFRSMAHHVAVVKVSDVHDHFTKKLPRTLIKTINKLKPLSKKLDSITLNNKLITSEKQAMELIRIIEKLSINFILVNDKVDLVGNGGVLHKEINKKLPHHLSDILTKCKIAKETGHYLSAFQHIQTILEKTNSSFHNFFTIGRHSKTQRLYADLKIIANGKNTDQPDFTSTKHLMKKG